MPHPDHLALIEQKGVLAVQVISVKAHFVRMSVSSHAIQARFSKVEIDLVKLALRSTLLHVKAAVLCLGRIKHVAKLVGLLALFDTQLAKLARNLIGTRHGRQVAGELADAKCSST